MGQYYMTVNLDKMQFLYPHKLGDGLKLLEFGCSANGTMTALAVLLSDGNGRGGGDLHSDNPIIGTWAGDRIVIAGDYADPGRHYYKEGKVMKPIPEDVTLYSFCQEHFEDISDQVKVALMDDPYIKEDLEKSSWK